MPHGWLGVHLLRDKAGKVWHTLGAGSAGEHRPQAGHYEGQVEGYSVTFLFLFLPVLPGKADDKVLGDE